MQRGGAYCNDDEMREGPVYKRARKKNVLVAQPTWWIAPPTALSPDLHALAQVQDILIFPGQGDSPEIAYDDWFD